MSRNNGATIRRRNAPQRPKHGLRRYDSYVPSVVVVRCPTGKQGFAEHVAQAKLDAYAEGSDNRLNRPKRIYYHELCGSWHLTSQETYP